jgi:hypothetical protein
MTPTQLGWRVEIPTPMVRRLCRDFAALSPDAVERCVSDVWLRGRHLGLDLTPGLVERVAREHLVCRVKSEPPSARRAEPPTGE